MSAPVKAVIGHGRVSVTALSHVNDRVDLVVYQSLDDDDDDDTVEVITANSFNCSYAGNSNGVKMQLTANMTASPWTHRMVLCKFKLDFEKKGSLTAKVGLRGTTLLLTELRLGTALSALVA